MRVVWAGRIDQTTCGDKEGHEVEVQFDDDERDAPRRDVFCMKCQRVVVKESYDVRFLLGNRHR